MIRWSVPREWEGETVFIVAGGPSFTSDAAARLHGRRVIAINSAWRTVPFADVLFFGDARWWHRFGGEAVEQFAGRLVTTSLVSHKGERVLTLHKLKPPKWATDPAYLTMQKTSVTAALNYCCHAGASRAVICGLDGKVAEDGRRHHHGEKYPWALKPDSFDLHAAEFRSVAPAIEAAGLDVTIANPDSRHDCWPRKKFEECL